MTRRVLSARAVLATVLASSIGVLTACGSSSDAEVTPGDAASGAPSTSSSPSESASPTATPTSAPTGPRTYTSDLEARPPVKAALAWAAAVADEVNSRSADHAQTRPLTTARGQSSLPKLYEEDYVYRYPGPLPIGPQRLVVDGRSATLTACVMTSGWAVQRGTNQETSSETYSLYTIVLRRQAGVWKMDQFNGTGSSCSAADLKGAR